MASQRAILLLRWKDLLFLHWKQDPAAIARHLPAGLRPDTYEGAGYVGLIVLTMQRVRPRFAPPLPWISTFHQLNLRTYVRDAQGNPGVYFLALDADQPLAVWFARRWLGLPYHRSRIQLWSEQDGYWRVRAQRHGGAEVARFEWSAQGGPFWAAPGSLEHFLTERYRLFVSRSSLISVEIRHPPFMLRRAEVADWDSWPLRQAGFELPGGPPESALTGGEVRVQIFPPG